MCFHYPSELPSLVCFRPASKLPNYEICSHGYALLCTGSKSSCSGSIGYGFRAAHGGHSVTMSWLWYCDYATGEHRQCLWFCYTRP